MRKTQDVKMLNVDGKEIVIVSGRYRGQPMMYYEYDLLVGPEDVIKRYYKDLVPEHQTKKGWMPKIQYI
jgi:hypothetical protein